MQSFHHGGQHHPSVGGGSEVVGGSGGSGVGVGHPVGVNSQVQDQNTAVTQDQIAHQSVNPVGHPGQGGQIPAGIPNFVHKVDIPHYFGRALPGNEN